MGRFLGILGVVSLDPWELVLRNQLGVGSWESWELVLGNLGICFLGILGVGS